MQAPIQTSQPPRTPNSAAVIKLIKTIVDDSSDEYTTIKKFRELINEPDFDPEAFKKILIQSAMDGDAAAILYLATMNKAIAKPKPRYGSDFYVRHQPQDHENYHHWAELTQAIIADKYPTLFAPLDYHEAFKQAIAHGHDEAAECIAIGFFTQADYDEAFEQAITSSLFGAVRILSVLPFNKNIWQTLLRKAGKKGDFNTVKLLYDFHCILHTHHTKILASVNHFFYSPELNHNTFLVLAAAACGDLDTLKSLLSLLSLSGINPKLCELAIELATECDHLEALKLLLNITVKPDLNNIFEDALRHGSIEVIQYLTTLCDSAFIIDIKDSIKTALEYGYSEIVKFFLPRLGSKCLNSSDFLNAVENDHLEIVKLFFDPVYHQAFKFNGPLLVEKIKNALQKDQLKAIQFLITLDNDQTDEGFSVFFEKLFRYAMQFHHFNIIKLLVKQNKVTQDFLDKEIDFALEPDKWLVEDKSFVVLQFLSTLSKSGASAINSSHLERALLMCTQNHWFNSLERLLTLPGADKIAIDPELLTRIAGEGKKCGRPDIVKLAQRRELSRKIYKYYGEKLRFFLMPTSPTLDNDTRRHIVTTAINHAISTEKSAFSLPKPT